MTSFVLLYVFVVALTSSSKADPQSPRVTDFQVPRHVEVGTNPTLVCSFDMRGVALYTVKYYFNGDEFYRYTPKDEEIQQFFGTTPVVVDLNESGQNKVTLKNVSLAFTGVYTCEVNGEEPDFLTDRKESNMTVTVIPDEKPTVEGFTGPFALGHVVDLNCTGAPSIPPASLTWYINDEEAPEEFLVPYDVVTTSDGLKEARLGLRFTVRDKHYVQSVLKLRCKASVATFYTKSDEHSHQQHKPNPDDVNDIPPVVKLPNKASAGSSLFVSAIIASFGLCILLLL